MLVKTNKHYRPHRIGINIATWPVAGGLISPNLIKGVEWVAGKREGH